MDPGGAHGQNGKQHPPAVQITILVNPLSGALNIHHPGVPRLGVIEVLGEAMKILARAEFQKASEAEKSKIQTAGAAALRAIPPINGG